MNSKESIENWWAQNPMTYGAVHGRAEYTDGHFDFSSREFFERLDREFYSWNSPLHDKRPFDRLFPYNEYGSQAKVLEIGCGLGTMAMNWARNGTAVTAVDLNPTSVRETSKRFQLHGLAGDITSMDGNHLSFAD